MRLATFAFWPLLLCAMLAPSAVAFSAEQTADSTLAWYAFDDKSEPSADLKVVNAHWEQAGSGPLVSPAKRENRGSLHFDGKQSLVFAAGKDFAERLAEGFTWEGFFYSPPGNKYETDGAIGDRFISQFLNEEGTSTRLTIGLVAALDGGDPLLCVALTGTNTLHRGKLTATPGMWHHFALVHEGSGSKGKLTWYLDYVPAGEVVLNGKSPRTTLSPAGPAPLALGGRLLEGKTVDRGFQGLLDELRLSSRPLKPQEFLRVEQLSFERSIKALVYEGTRPDDWTLTGVERAEQWELEAFAFTSLPGTFTERGYPVPRSGRQAIRAAEQRSLPAGTYRLVLRTRSDAVLSVDGEPLIDARRRVPDHPLGALPRTPRDYVAKFESDGKPHEFVLTAAYKAGPESELGDVIVSYAPEGSEEWRLLGLSEEQGLSPATWAAYRSRLQQYLHKIEPERRAAAIRRGNRKWEERHERARELSSSWRTESPQSGGNPIDALIEEELAGRAEEPAAVVDAAAFFRRLSLDTRGRIPTRDELLEFLADDSPNKRTAAVDRMLASSEWADSWVGYWQDVLAENPSILKPTLNNSGPFRRWIYDSIRRNVALDRFATELILMEGSNERGGTAGFAQATNNDAPMAMKAHVVLQAFMAVDMKCARCHDSPTSAVTQRDLFNLAAMLRESPVKVPKTSVVPPVLPGGRQPAVTASLKAGESVKPAWPLAETYDHRVRFDNPQLATDAESPRMRARLASIITSPENPRFSDVLANRVWKRYIGWGLVEPVDSWSDHVETDVPPLLRLLSSHLVESGYDLKSLARLIFTSKYYQRQVRDLPPPEPGTVHAAKPAPARRRLTAEQLVDSLHVAMGKEFGAEELTFDPHETRGFLNLGTPRRAWQLTSLSNERDRPALSMPVNQSIVDVLVTFGWRATRPDPITERDVSPSPLQPLMLANGLMSWRTLRLTEDNRVTELCLQDVSVEQLAAGLFESVLSREPDAKELALVAETLRPAFESRRTGKPKRKPEPLDRAYVDWDKHLDAEASRELLEAERLVRQGDPPTVRLTTGFRERVEDVLWALVNSPEFVFVP